MALEEIVPEGREDLRTDPYSGLSFIYRLDEPDFVLYGVGEDEIDDGGKVVNIRMATSRKPGFDLDVDTMIRP